MTTVTVVIPVLNDARMLERCLESLAHQTRRPDEVIIVDNGSTDDSALVAHRYAATLIDEPRPGITAAAARGFDTATGEIIARCDADSILPPTWIERIERTLDENPEAVAVTGPGTFYNMNRTIELLARGFYIYGYFLSMRLLLGHHVLYGSNCAVRSEAWRAVSASVPRDDSEIHDDMDLSYRLPAHSRVRLDNALVVGISARPFDSISVYVRRLRRAVHTFSLHLPDQLPHRRYAARRRTMAAMPQPRQDARAAQS
ncbi:glycosyltransferase family 2 protein [Leucobacter weissii]|uniref:Glycosyltransferase family 2 protein n=1 Tax=Leucobacter weissii TaxID=1983706 RepID=A0A939SCL6_9MICO|nr:glycosyltransferase family A protein [Leucobacter weissii]MBO1902488.1 glycosyltransferase family 2 protein [Leucobacter weissii]